MPIDLPTYPALRTAKIRLLDWGGRLVPILGGPVQTIMRLGTRFSLEFTVPPMPSEPNGRLWGGALVQAKLQGVRTRFLQDGFTTGAPGSPVVDGSGQTGMVLNIKSGQPGYRFRQYQFISLVHGGRRYLHMVTARVDIGADGKASLPIAPMLRVITTNGDAVEVAKPMIEGTLTGDEVGWNVMTEPMTDVGSIRIDEDE